MNFGKYYRSNRFSLKHREFIYTLQDAALTQFNSSAMIFTQTIVVCSQQRRMRDLQRTVCQKSILSYDLKALRDAKLEHLDCLKGCLPQLMNQLHTTTTPDNRREQRG
ncbi:hypothetical protein AVEN_208100-1 [Araneus ventricosus]|uniref:Uncharacterized protein n=1 Tax=Araneus ventricosus TaxID=182803 RepID=A0A4Y2FW69_ARAVE|nr:hypothetical protein AVEN_208100-1 [Araneus ventricosus]